ncbi:MAG: hypothetical protein GEU80_17580 [Dehalococcoidia bacterium]|nr:hypothetical protein [Dehalococcoidia bacterium]
MVEPDPAYRGSATGQSTRPWSADPEPPSANGWGISDTPSHERRPMLPRAVGVLAAVVAVGATLAWLAQRRKRRRKPLSRWERTQQSAMQNIESLTAAAQEAARLARERKRADA